MLYHIVLVAIILGIVEGLTEFLPVSSSAHLIICSHFLGVADPAISILQVVIQLGAILSIVVVFWPRLILFLPTCTDQKSFKGTQIGIPHILVATLPIAVLGWLLHAWIKQKLTQPILVCYGLVMGSLLLILAEINKGRKHNTLEQITLIQAFIIGCFQCLALCPGFSRSGATIAGGLLIGLNRVAAVQFSFMLALPTIAGAAFLDLMKNYQLLTWQHVPFLFFGFFSAFFSALAVIRYCLAWIQSSSLIPLALYRLFVAYGVYKLFY